MDRNKAKPLMPVWFVADPGAPEECYGTTPIKMQMSRIGTKFTGLIAEGWGPESLLLRLVFETNIVTRLDSLTKKTSTRIGQAFESEFEAHMFLYQREEKKRIYAEYLKFCADFPITPVEGVTIDRINQARKLMGF